MSLKFAAIGNLMAISALENRARVDDRFKALSPVEIYDLLLAFIGRSRRTEPMKPESEEQTVIYARW